MARALTQDGHDVVTTANDGAEALEVLTRDGAASISC